MTTNDLAIDRDLLVDVLAVAVLLAERGADITAETVVELLDARTPRPVSIDEARAHLRAAEAAGVMTGDGDRAADSSEWMLGPERRLTILRDGARAYLAQRLDGAALPTADTEPPSAPDRERQASSDPLAGMLAALVAEAMTWGHVTGAQAKLAADAIRAEIARAIGQAPCAAPVEHELERLADSARLGTLIRARFPHARLPGERTVDTAIRLLTALADKEG